MRTRLSRCVFVLFAIATLLGSSEAQDAPTYTRDELTERSIERRAVEAVIWGMPAVNYDLMLQELLTKTQGQVNEIVYWSRPVDWRNQTLTPNPDAIYLMTFFNTQSVGPVVIDVPPAEGGSFAGNIDDVWQVPLEDAGPNGADQGRGGKYLIVPPDYSDTPPAGYIPLRSDTYRGYALFRSNLESHADADVSKAVDYGKRLKIYPLSRAADPPATQFTDAIDVVFDSTIPYDIRFFESLNRVVQSEPWLERDRVMIDRLKSIGIEKGKPFEPNAETKKILESAAAEAHAWIEQQLDAGFPPFYPGGHWGVPAMPELVKEQPTGFADRDSYPTDARAITYAIGYIGIKRFGTAQLYLMAIKDKDGEALDGGETYRLTVPPNVPVKQYWSATVYDRATHALIRDLSRASRASMSTEKNADGSVDVYFAPEAPAGKGQNWIPTRAGGRFEVLFRLYGPERPLFDKMWRLPDIEKVD